MPAFDNSPIPKMEPAQADEQRRQFAEFEQKRKNRRAGTRSAAWERNPFLAFLGANGLNRDTASEFAPGLTERRKAFVPGYGPVFRPGAKNLDELVQTAKEGGFLRDDDGEPELYDLIDRALRGERIAPLFADGAAEAEGQRRQQAMQEREGATFEDYLEQQEQESDPLDFTVDADYDEQDLAEIGSADVSTQNEVAALQQQYADLGFDPADVLESLATQTENQTDQQFYDLAKSRFIQLIDQAYGQAEPQAEQGSNRAVRQPDGQEGAAQADGSAAGGQGQTAAVTPPAAPAVAQPRRTDAIRAKLDDLKSQGFSQFTRSSGRTLLLNPDTYETVELTPAEMAVARTASGQAKAGLQSLRGRRNPVQADQQGVDVLQSYSPADVLTQEEQASQQQAADQAERDKAQAQARADDERKRIEQASYAAADSFELGQNPLDSLTGQRDIFGIKPQDEQTEPDSFLVDRASEVAEKAPTKKAFAESIMGLFVGETRTENQRQALFDALGLNRGVKQDEFRAALDSYYDDHKDGRKSRERLHKLAVADSNVRKVMAQAAAVVADEQAQSDLAGKKINDEWTAFDPQSGTLGIPRTEMPQIKAEHRGAMVNFLKARGIDGQQETIPSAAIKPTQAEFSPAKVKQAIDYQGGNRSIIVSADGYVVDGHHQWLAAREKGEPIQAIRLDQNIGDVLAALKDMPSAQPEQAPPDRELKSGPAAAPPPEFASFEAKKALLELSQELASAEGSLNERGNALARTPWGELSESDRALALKLSQDKQASNDANNARVREGMRQIRRRQLQNERTITQASGKPFKTEAGAKAMLDQFDLGDTHKIVSEGGGYALRQMPPAEQAEVRRKAEGRESYMEAQAAVIAEMGIPETADGEIDATDDQWDEIDRRISERLGQKPVDVAKPAASKQPDAAPAPQESPVAQVTDAGQQADEPIASRPFATAIEKTKTGWAIKGDPDALVKHARDLFGKGVVKRKDGISLATKNPDVAGNFPVRFDEYRLADLPERHGRIEVRVNQDGSASVRSMDGGYMGPLLPSVAEAIANHRNEFGGSDSSIKQADAQPAGSTAAANEATKLKTVRDVADKLGMEYVSGLLADSLKKGQAFSLQGKKYTVTAVTDSRIRFKSEDGKNIEALKYGNKLVSGGNAKSQPYAQFVRDLEGVISVDLINENNPFHKPSEVFALAQKALDALPADMKEVRPEIAEPGIKPAKDLAGNKRDTAPTLEEVQAETAKSPLEKVEAELADWKRRRALPTNQAQVGVIDEEIAKLEAQVKAMREFEGQNDELDGKMQGYERKADEQALRMRIRELKRKIEQIPESIDVSGDFSVGRLETNTLGIAGDGWYVLDKNGKKASGQYRTKAEAERLRSTLVSSNPEREALIKELEAAVDALAAMRDTQNTASKQPAITADPDLEAIFDQLDGITQRTQASGQQAAAAHPQAERIQLVQKHILDILEDLEDSGKVTINC